MATKTTDSRQEPTDKQRARDKNGRFVRGNKEGNRFQPGNNENPAGRPPGNSVTEQIRAKLPKVHPKDKEGRTNSELIADVLLNMAIGRDLGAIKEVIDRSDGKVPNKNEHSGPHGRPIQLEQKRAEDYGNVLEDLAGLSQGSSAGEPVDSSQPD